jgi:hypothetical protein
VRLLGGTDIDDKGPGPRRVFLDSLSTAESNNIVDVVVQTLAIYCHWLKKTFMFRESLRACI